MVIINIIIIDKWLDYVNNITRFYTKYNTDSSESYITDRLKTYIVNSDLNKIKLCNFSKWPNISLGKLINKLQARLEGMHTTVDFHKIQ